MTSADRWRPWLRRAGPDLVGVLWLAVAAGAVLGPALAHGSSLGPIDWLRHYGLGARPGGAGRDRQSYDLVTEMIPWTALSWTQVHHGHLPLWNPYNVLGTPLAFNWQSSAFALPSLLGYLAPLRLAFTVQVVVTVLVAGTGAYVLTRLLGVGPLGAAAAGTVYELSGAFVAWLGWPMASVLSWAGWLFAAVVLVVRGRRRARAVAALAVVVALAVYAGQPDALVLLGAAAAVFAGALVVQRAPAFGGDGPVLRPVVDLVVGAAAGGALAAPLLLPGAQLLARSLRGAKGASQALPARDLTYLFFQGFDGSPVGTWFGPSFYVRTAAYVGVVAVVLAVVGVAVSVGRGRRRPEVVAVGAAGAACALLVVLPPVALGSVQWHRALLPLDFALAVLAGVGTDALVRGRPRSRVLGAAGAGFAGAGVVVALVWLVGRGHLPPHEASLRDRSFLWPAAETVLGLLVVAVLARRRGTGAGTDGGGAPDGGGRRRNPGWWAAVVLLACDSAFLVAAGAPLPASSPAPLAPTAAERALGRAVGASLVAFGTSTCFTPQQLGSVPDVNDAFGIRQFADYDPLLPGAYGTTWVDQTGQEPLQRPAGSLVPFSLFCPAVTSAAQARLYGIGFVLEPAGATAPAGLVRDRSIGGEALYRVPGSAPATLVASTASGPPPPRDAPGTAVAVTGTDSDSWHLTTDAARWGELRLRLSDVPGWHATLDGHPLALAPFAGVMLQARVPPGRHVVAVTYRPAAFSAGLVLAALGVLGLVAVPVLGRLRRRRPARRGAASGDRHRVGSAPSPAAAGPEPQSVSGPR